MAKTKLTIEDQYHARCAEGPAEFLKEKGADGKRLARFAFDGTYQPYGPFDATTPDALNAVIADHLAQAASLYDKGAHFGSAVVKTAQQTARGLHTHAGKYVHAGSPTRLLRVAQAERSPYLSSGSSAGMRSITCCFGHAPKESGKGKLFIANVLLAGRIVSIAELIAEDHPGVAAAFARGGITASEYALIKSAFDEAFARFPEVDHSLPQLLWPVGDRYVGLVPVPAVSVYNAIASLRSRVEDGNRLPRTSFMVGSGQAQNISVAASSVSGHMPLLRCEPPYVAQTEAKALARRMHANKLLDFIPKVVLDKFDVEIHPRPNANRAAFMKRAAQKHVSIALASAVALRDLVYTGKVESADLPAPSASPLAAFVAGVPLSGVHYAELTRLVVEQGPAARFARHTEADLAIYYTALATAIQSLEAL